jgi:hypothetical protein
MQTASAFEVLKSQLFELPAGAVTKMERIAALLAGCWREFMWSSSERMHAGKLGRMEMLRWDPPVLSFTIERHGAIGVGSTRAEIQQWRVNIDRKTAQCERSRNYRQARPRAEGVRIEPVARELADSIIAGRADQRLKWQGDETVRILMTKIFPSGSGYMQTVTGRRKRLRETLGTLLVAGGWQELRRDVYSKSRFGGTQA